MDKLPKDEKSANVTDDTTVGSVRRAKSTAERKIENALNEIVTATGLTPADVSIAAVNVGEDGKFVVEVSLHIDWSM